MAGFLSKLRDLKLYFNKSLEYLESGNRLVKNSIKKSGMIKNNEEISNDYQPESKKLRTNNSSDETLENKIKIRKRNVALLLGYNGSAYYGMQKNCEIKTIESELLGALIKAECIPSEAMNNLHLIHFQRAARTDKGVSAVKQVVSFKIAENYDVNKINSYLPDDIKVFSIKRVTKGFNCKNECYGRTYSYTLPTFALASEFYEEYPENYRINNETLQKLKEELNKFVGTHSFHNFTSRKDSKDPSAKRYIRSFEALDPFVDGEEFITLRVKGQSFMLHQIRKMVGYTIAILKGLANENIQSKVFTNEKLYIPMAPGLGLVLEDIHYDRYNQKFGSDGMHDSLTWNEFDQELKSFRDQYILKNIICTEKLEKSMYNWLENIKKHKFENSEQDALLEAIQ